MLRYAITDRTQFPGEENSRLGSLIDQAARLSNEGVDFLQVREKNLGEAAQVELVRRIRSAIQDAGGTTQVLLNNTPAMAQWAGADGVHLSSTSFAQNLQTHHGLLVSASCHTMHDVRRAAEFADLILFAPVFEKRADGQVVVEGAGLNALREACVLAGDVPVLALGGVTKDNAQLCLDAGAKGVAGIRLFV